MAQAYRICVADTPANLASAVNELLSQGWNLYGYPFVHDPGNGNSARKTYCQAVLLGAAPSPAPTPEPTPVQAPKKAPSFRPVPARPPRPRVAATLRSVAAFLAILMGAYFLLEALIFRSGVYVRYLLPESTTGFFEMVTHFELQRKPSGRKEVMIVGSSRLGEGFSAKMANELKPDDGYWFINGSIPGANVRSWYYFIREVDPRRDRYKAILIPIDDYDDPDTFEDVPDRTMELREAVHRLRFTDILPFTFSFRTWPGRLQMLRGSLLKGLVYQRDFQEFVEDPPTRLKAVEDWRVSGESWLNTYGGIQHSLAGLAVDWTNRRITGMPSDMQGDNWIQDARMHLLDPTPQDGLNRTDQVRWIGALMDLYRGHQTKLIVYQVPRGPAMPPYPRARLSWTTVDVLAKRPGATIIDRHKFEGLERPELFADWVHLNSEGRAVFTRMLAGVAKEIVH